MSAGGPGDIAATHAQVNNPTPFPWMGRNWLRHGQGTQAAHIDQLLLEGNHTIPEMAAIVDCTAKRIHDHLDHLREFWNGTMEPHHLSLVEDSQGRWRFGV
jgi:hypothetical protein